MVKFKKKIYKVWGFQMDWKKKTGWPSKDCVKISVFLICLILFFKGNQIVKRLQDVGLF